MWRQQRSQQILETDNPDTLIDPRVECLLELEKEIKTQRELGSILMVLDANDTRDATSDGYDDFANRLDLIPLMDLETEVPSRFGGNQVIGHMETYGISEQHVVRRGQLPKGVGFLSDHRGMFTGINLKGLLGLTLDKPKERTPRQLKSGNRRSTNKYILTLKERLDSHKVMERFTTLWRDAQNGSRSSEQQQEYKRLDHTITESMLVSEKN